jgi:hypothetical protein
VRGGTVNERLQAVKAKRQAQQTQPCLNVSLTLRGREACNTGFSFFARRHVTANND